MKNLFYALLLLAPGLCHAQGDQTIITVPINASGTTTFQAILHLPDDYATSSTKYPLLMFFHGSGEGGPNPVTIYGSSGSGGPAYWIAQGLFPSSFVNPADGKSYKFIVVSPQANPPGIQMSTTAQEADYIISYLYAHYRIDTTRLYLTGLSDGGETACEYPGGIMSNGGNELRFTRTHRVAAVLPMSENGIANLIPEQADSITAEKIGFWGFGSTDEQGQNTLQLAWYCNQNVANWAITTSYTGGHCCWGQFYNPSFTQNGMSMYQWMLQYTSTGGGPAGGTVPVANGGAPQTITLPTTQTTLNGSASKVQGGTITKYAWSQQSGPSKATIATPTSATTTVSGLNTPGTNVFALQITDNTGRTATATTQVTVNASATSVTLPGTVQAENFTSESGVSTQTTTDAGGGVNVDYIDNGDWMNYLVNATAAGAYTVAFRVATPNSGASFQVKNSSGTVLATVSVPNTGGYQTWTNVNATVTLPAGSQTLQVVSTASPEWNLNWMQFNSNAPSGATIPGTIQAESYSSMSGVSTQGTSDVGGGLNVDYIDNGDWMDYTENVAAAGTYTVSFRVATPNNGASFQVRNASGTVLATVPVPNTGGFQNWTTISAVVTLPAGSQTLQLYSNAAPEWNINYMEFAGGGDSGDIPGTIQAENYSTMSGVSTQGTSDAGGGQNVDYIDNGDWMDYNIDAASSGTYTVGFRVATPNSGASFQVRSSTGAVLASVSVPKTGGFQTWTTVNASVTVPAGSQTLQVYSTAAPEWNLNWMQFATTGSDASDTSLSVSTDSTFQLYPNPVRSNFTLNITNGRTGNTIVRVMDLSGNTRQVVAAYKDQQQMMLNVNASELPVGMYFVQVEIGAWHAVKKIIKE